MIGPGQAGMPGPGAARGARVRRRVAGLAAWLALTVGSAFLPGAGVAGPESAPPALDIELQLFLIGDAGNPDKKGDPVLLALGQELSKEPGRSVVVFLGDNIYPKGLPAPDAGDRREMERRIDAQIDVARAKGARAIFLPGNHDWEKQKPGGWEAVKRQGAHVEARGAPLVGFLPRDGCPGPEVVDFGERVRLVALDTQWWLQDGPKPQDPVSDCPADSESEVVAALRRVLEESKGRDVVVAGHHPLATGGPHGGYFSFRDHVFPLTEVHKGLWLPLPFVGSLYPLSRKGGVSSQDLSSDRNREMREALEGVLREQPPLAYAAGHEHTLQVIESPSARRLLVSGAGYFGHTSAVERVPGSRFATSASGYMRLDFDRGRGVRLAVLGVDAGARAREVYAEWLIPAR